MWQHGLDVEPMHIDSNGMALLVYSNPLQNPWLLNIVYYLAQNNKKWKLWHNLGPMLGIGDFNSILCQSKKYWENLFPTLLNMVV